jgi:hypothetical protein
MLIPRYWFREASHATTPEGKRVDFHVWRGARGSLAEAQSLARETVARIAARIRRGEGFPERYAYGDRPLREEVVREIGAAGDEGPEAAVTRNAYGALVLNAARVFFIDVDVPPPGRDRSPSALWDLAARLLGRAPAEALPPAVFGLLEGVLGSPAAPPAADPAAGPLERLRRWVEAHPAWRVRVYRTRAGLRYMVVHDLFRPEDGEAQSAMDALGSDPQYVRLCRAQRSFRARLTPKPWRVRMAKPPVRFPYEDAAEERAMRDWEARYARASAGHATCALLEEIGGGTEHPEVAPLRALHDEETRAASGLPLA